MRTRNMGSKHVPVGRVNAVMKDPKSYNQAMRDIRAAKWNEAMKTEIRHGTIERYKARLVTRADEQEYGVDYCLSFSAVLEMASGKLILMISKYGVFPRIMATKFTEQELRALGVKNNHKLALMLDKRLYGLKESERLWNPLLHKGLVSGVFLQCYTYSWFYVKSEVDGITLVGIYVDDILVTATSAKKVDKFFLDMQIVE
ncbi:Pol Polyprotein [Phytophthora megakarya]|uniref:Pol Polyprotein n=1 Tax=Phytophthora megakarya TaxID=4795 RepID=A0A225X4D3_9STRA|nr:Pol Polyprotein [Phytophthora megakarya]